MTTTLLVITDDTSAADMREAITNMNAHAKRQPYVVKRFDCDPPTKWDMAHGRIDALLYDLEAAAAATCRTCGLSRARCEKGSGCCPICRHD